MGQPLPAGQRPRRRRVQPASAAIMAQVAEVEVAKDGRGAGAARGLRRRLRHRWSIPDTIKAQMEGGIIFGLTAALYGEITIKDGRVEQTNFDDYRVLRINEAPVIEVHLVKSTEAPGGIGEPGTSAIARR